MIKIKYIINRVFFLLLGLQMLHTSTCLSNVYYTGSCYSQYTDHNLSYHQIADIDDDETTNSNSPLEKYSADLLFLEQPIRSDISHMMIFSAWSKGFDQANKTCKGYFYIISPPPIA